MVCDRCTTRGFDCQASPVKKIWDFLTKTAVGKSQVCDECRCLKIQCSLVLAGGQRGPKRKTELDTDETALPKRLKPVVEVSGMRPELTTWEVLLEHSELLGDVQGLLKSQLEEMKGL